MKALARWKWTSIWLTVSSLKPRLLSSQVSQPYKSVPLKEMSITSGTHLLSVTCKFFMKTFLNFLRIVYLSTLRTELAQPVVRS